MLKAQLSRLVQVAQRPKLSEGKVNHHQIGPFFGTPLVLDEREKEKKRKEKKRRRKGGRERRERGEEGEEKREGEEESENIVENLILDSQTLA